MCFYRLRCVQPTTQLPTSASVRTRILVRVRVRFKRQDGRIEQYEAIYRIIRFTIN